VALKIVKIIVVMCTQDYHGRPMIVITK